MRSAQLRASHASTPPSRCSGDAIGGNFNTDSCPR